MKSKWTAIILAIFLWGIWVHHFYLGNTWRFVMYLTITLLTAWFMGIIFALVSIVEAILWMFWGKKHWDEVYNKEHLERQELQKTQKEILEMQKAKLQNGWNPWASHG